MKRAGIWTVAVVAIVSVVVAIAVVQRRASLSAAERSAAMRENSERLVRLTAENEQLSNLVARVKSKENLSQEQARDLARLRGQIQPLREAAGQRKQLEATNAQLRVNVTEAEKRLAEAQALPNYWGKEQLEFAGYANPEAAMKSMLWAMHSLKTSDDLSAWRSSCTPEAQAGMEKEAKKHGRSEAEILAQMKGMCDMLMAGSSGFHIVNQTELAPDKVAVDLSFDGEDKVRKFILKKIGDEWKFHDLVVKGQGVPRR